MTGHQVIYGLHADTDNIHLHLAINRVHPESLKVVEINQGFDLEAAHRATARIEHAQGWQREPNARYAVLGNGEIERWNSDAKKLRQPGQSQQDREYRSGEKSAERIAIEEAAPIIKRAATWQQLHRELAEKGMRYERFGSGAKIFVGGVAVKASSVDREAGFVKLQKWLGPYEPPSPRQNAAERGPQALNPGDAPAWEMYISVRKSHYTAENAAEIALKQRQEEEKKQLAARQKQHRDKILHGSWQGRGILRNALQSVIAAEQASEKAALKERQQQEWAQLRQQYRPYPDFRQWQTLAEPPSIEGNRNEAPTPRDIRNYVAKIVGQQVHYTRKDEAGHGAVAFVDRGRRIEIHDWRNPNATLAALQLAAQKWGSFEVKGSDEYKALCVQLAAKHGFKMSNPELRESIREERMRRIGDAISKSANSTPGAVVAGRSH